MRITPLYLLQNEIVLTVFMSAWHDSLPGINGGHEEGGFILQHDTVDIFVLRWPIGERNQIHVPLHPACRIDGKDILASFHTHPNTGGDYLQEPSVTDRRAVRDDPNLKGNLYVGEFIISDQMIYLIQPDGEVIAMGSRHKFWREG